MDSKLTFGTKVSVDAFKAMHNTTKLNKCTNPVKGTSFITDQVGNVIAKISKKFDPAKERMFVECTEEDTKNTFWLMSNVNNVNVEDTF